MKYALWVVQGLLTLLFLFAGVTKLVAPLAGGAPRLMLQTVG
jgi:hypothetical protein